MKPATLLLLPLLALAGCASSHTRSAPPVAAAPAPVYAPAKPNLLDDTVSVTKKTGDATWVLVTAPAHLFDKKKPAPVTAAAPDEPPDLVIMAPQDDSGARPVMVAPAASTQP